MGVPAVFSYQYVHHSLMVHGNATATANNILAYEMLFRIGTVSELTSVLAFIFLVRALSSMDVYSKAWLLLRSAV